MKNSILPPQGGYLTHTASAFQRMKEQKWVKPLATHPGAGALEGAADAEAAVQVADNGAVGNACSDSIRFSLRSAVTCETIEYVTCVYV